MDIRTHRGCSQEAWNNESGGASRHLHAVLCCQALQQALVETLGNCDRPFPVTRADWFPAKAQHSDTDPQPPLHHRGNENSTSQLRLRLSRHSQSLRFRGKRCLPLSTSYLHLYNIPEQLVAAVMALYHNIQAAVITPDGLTDAFSTTSG